jgi:hypothetical protein
VTYKAPITNTASNPIFSLLFNCNFIAGYIGSRKIAKSVTVFVTAKAYQKASLLIHFGFWMDVSHEAWRGMHCRMVARVVPIAQMVMIVRRIFPVIWKLRVMKMRR